MPAAVRALGWVLDLKAHDFAEHLRTQRAATRKAMGVEMADLPYPGSITGNTVTTNHNYQPAPAVAPPSPPAVSPAAQVAPAAPAANAGQDEVTQTKQADGSWKETGRRPYSR